MPTKVYTRRAQLGTSICSLSLAAIGLSFLVAGCADDGQAPVDEAVSSADQAIIGGESIPSLTTTLRTVGLVEVNGWCSGSIVNANWALTAWHCVKTTTASQNYVSTIREDGRWDTRRATRVVKLHDSDIAMLELEPVTAAMDWPTVTRSSYTGSVSSLKGKSVTCYGRGSSAYVAGGGVTGTGEYRKATMKVASTSATELQFLSDNGNNISAPGDSGGPCIYNNQVVGVFSWYTYVCADKSTPERCLRSITKITNANYVATSPYAAEIADISGSVKTLIHAPNGDFNQSHTDSYMSYKSWNGGSWCARIYGNTFVHAENCNWAAAHSDSVITYVSGGNSNWAATLSGKTFTHAYEGNFASSHTDTILNYIEPSSGASWTVKIQ